MHREGTMQFQSPVALRLLPTLPTNQQLKGPLPPGSQTDRGGAAAAASKTIGSTGSKTHRAMASTNATSMAAVKQASERNQSLFIKIGETVNNVSAVLRADAGRDAGSAEAAEAAQALSDAVSGIIQPPQPLAVNGAGNNKNSSAARHIGAKDAVPALGRRGPSFKQSTTRAANTSAADALDALAETVDVLAADDPSSSSLIARIEKLMAACGGASSEAAAHEPALPRRRGAKAVKVAGPSANARSSNPVVVWVRRVPLGCEPARGHVSSLTLPAGLLTRNCGRCLTSSVRS